MATFHWAAFEFQKRKKYEYSKFSCWCRWISDFDFHGFIRCFSNVFLRTLQIPSIFFRKYEFPIQQDVYAVSFFPYNFQQTMPPIVHKPIQPNGARICTRNTMRCFLLPCNHPIAIFFRMIDSFSSEIPKSACRRMSCSTFRRKSSLWPDSDHCRWWSCAPDIEDRQIVTDFVVFLRRSWSMKLRSYWHFDNRILLHPHAWSVGIVWLDLLWSA